MPKTPKPKKVTVKMTMEVREQILRDRVHRILLNHFPPNENVMDSYIYRVGLETIDRANAPISDAASGAVPKVDASGSGPAAPGQ